MAVRRLSGMWKAEVHVEVRRAGWATAAMGLATGLAVAVPVVGRAGAS